MNLRSWYNRIFGSPPLREPELQELRERNDRVRLRLLETEAGVFRRREDDDGDAVADHRTEGRLG